MFQKSITTFSFFLLLTPVFLYAQETPNDKTQFQELFTVPEQDIEVPTVIEVPLPDMSGKKAQFLVTEESTETSVASLYQQSFEVEPVAITIKVNGIERESLVDAKQDSNETFPLPESGSGLVEFYIEGTEEFTASSFWVDLARNVSLPVFIEVKATVDGEEVIVLSKTRPNSMNVRFPQTTASNWYIAMEYIQPLRINELRFVQDDVEASVQNTLRFLAQPQTAYEVYFNPERFVSLQTPEGGNLVTDTDVLEVEDDILILENEDFTYADSDKDSVPDQIDNCVDIENIDQTDINQNGRGDVCDDFDKDGVMNVQDNCVNNPNRNQADEDGDGVGDVCDEEESRVTEKHEWIPWAAMAGAISVFVLLFWVMMRRMRGEAIEIEEKEAMKQPRSDSTGF